VPRKKKRGNKIETIKYLGDAKRGGDLYLFCKKKTTKKGVSLNRWEGQRTVAKTSQWLGGRGERYPNKGGGVGHERSGTVRSYAKGGKPAYRNGRN